MIEIIATWHPFGQFVFFVFILFLVENMWGNLCKAIAAHGHQEEDED